MTTDSSRYRALPQLRRAVRRLAHTHRLPVELRARLVVSVTAVARPELAAGRYVSLESSVENRSEDRPGLLVVACRSPQREEALRATGLPLPAEVLADGAAVWRAPLPRRPTALPAGPSARRATATGALDRPGGNGSPVTGQPPEADAVEEELLEVMARADTLASEHRRLERELAETNRGVLALYVQLEERDEKLRKAHGKTLRELEDALRPPPLHIDGVELAVHYEPAGTDAPTGGDLYDWFVLPDGTVHITVVDALGHGVTSTRSALNVTHAVRTLALEGHPLESIVGRTDEILLPFDRDLMATVLLARLDPATGVLLLANGSHPPALLLRADGSAEYLELPGRGIGFPLSGSERLLRTELGPDDLLVLYTDGLTESRRDPREGEARLVETALRHAALPLAEIPGAIAEDMHTVILHPDDTLAMAVRMPHAPRP
ncbi:PP2C family protein-serine/threonine phosphatase [Streptomyces sodiiphilus]|uniref:PP2C family protein-serine/threonine phosphatase n=1 Tax=Streptomyces sodiiphilus TaxID=226217 RepID=A0ABP5AFE0_9ACTN